MFEQPSFEQRRDKIADWVLRCGVAAAFILFGFEKFESGSGGPWVRFFAQVRLGQWFRYFTGIVEIVAGILVLLPKTSRIGLAILALTMATASMIHILIIRQPANVIVTGGLCFGLIAFWWKMRES